MDALTTDQLLREIQILCAQHAFVKHIEQRLIDVDILDVRLQISPNSFISVFYNLKTDKTAFALIQNGQRSYGIDNAKMGWHEHPFGAPERHEPCEPTALGEFLTQVARHLKS